VRVGPGVLAFPSSLYSLHAHEDADLSTWAWGACQAKLEGAKASATQKPAAKAAKPAGGAAKAQPPKPSTLASKRASESGGSKEKKPRGEVQAKASAPI
jgi:hypothetical protein